MADLFRLRLSLLDGPELRCPHCTEWWAIDTEHWQPNEWHMCLPCKRERAKLYARIRQRDAQYRTDKAAKSRRYRAWLAINCPQYLPAYERERRMRERVRAKGHRDAKKEKP